jgi:very-short-patch-repair endonuclease
MSEAEQNLIAPIVRGRRRQDKQELALEMRRLMTPAEALLWARLRKNQLNGLHFRRQQVIDGYIADFYCSAAGLVVECDGGIHRQRAEYDNERDQIIAGHNLCVLRFLNENIERDLETVISEIAHVAAERILARGRHQNSPFLPREGG